MSQFEYLRSISIGQYLPLDSAIHRLDPRSKIIGFTIMILAVTLTVRFSGLLVALMPILLLLAASRTPTRYVLRGLASPLPFLVILAVMQLFISPHIGSSQPLFTILGLSVYPEGLSAAARLLVRFAALLALLTISTSTTSSLEVIHGLETLLRPLNHIGIRTDPIVMVVQITLRFIPFLALNAEKIAKSQASRGAEWDKGSGSLLKRTRRIFPLIIPLFSGSLRQAETLAEAMVARGFESHAVRTNLYAYRFKLRDAVFIMLCYAFAAVILFPFI